MARTVTCVIAVFLLAACGHKSHSGDPSTDRCGDIKSLDRAIVNGVDHPEVVELTDGQIKAIGALSLDFTGTCSATLVAPDVVLTAAHCVESISGAPRFLVGDSYLPPEASFRAEDWFTHPRYAGSGSADPAFDLAVVIISGDPLAEGIEPLPVNYEVTSLLEETVQLVGYGVTDPTDGWNTTRWWTTHEVVAEEPAAYRATDRGESGVCQGDSGGPMLWTMDDGTVRIMAVASSIDSEDCLGNAFYARTDIAAEWLQGFIVMDPCGTETWEGRCQGDMAIWCEDGETFYHVCSEFGYECGVNSDGLHRCMPPCGDETFEGRCQGEMAVWCEDEETFYHVCPEFGYVCARNEDGNFRCVAPGACEGITFQGFCDGETAVWCEDEEIWQHICDAFGYSCGEDSDGNFRCITECDVLGFQGECAGDVARWCVGHTIFERDCAECDQECGWTGGGLGFYCL